ncbi:MAG: zf-HC2 domain-containing protein [Burkholderiaceae bacterium]|nr:zf-HC2 domain-containing protein [Burkholderiaceae bacterium]
MTTKCPTIEAMSAYADGELAAEQRTALDEHLASCARCRSWLVALRAAQRELRSLADESLGFDLSQVVRGRIEALPRPAAAGRAGSRSGWRWLVPAGLGAAASVALGLALGLVLTAPTALPRPLGGALEVFAPGAPGGLCAGAGSCRVLYREAIR